ncbi:hypothetical protein QBC44DRAFT_22033 [Cladorrhinum sp. PSN332]|nr:hypothetical protein QBC44DRAFT_22033 [Cladorrhinum sp. PSN332]
MMLFIGQGGCKWIVFFLFFLLSPCKLSRNGKGYCSKTKGYFYFWRCDGKTGGGEQERKDKREGRREGVGKRMGYLRRRRKENDWEEVSGESWER